MAYIKGNFKKYIFKSLNGYTVGLFNVKESNVEVPSRVVTITGFLPDLNELDLYKFEGDFVFHDKYGEQFNVTSYEVLLPNDKDNVVSFLSSELFKGIGEAKALKIVDTLGEDCLNLILDDPAALLKVKGLTLKQRNTIVDALSIYSASYERMLTLTKLGFSIKNAIKIEKYYGPSLNEAIEHPYQITSDIPDVSYPAIDRIRSNLKIKDDNIERVSYGIIYVMENLSFKTGNIYFSYDEVLSATVKSLFVNTEVVNEGIAYLVTDGKIIIDDDKYILTDSYNKSLYIAKRIFNLSKNFENNNYEDDLISLEDMFGYSFNDEQKDAIYNALNYNFSVISGGPGTGKTTIIKAIVKLYESVFKVRDLSSSLYLLAPTGRASKRMSEQASFPSYTIHRFLKWDKESNTFFINEDNLSNAKMIIIDEASMIDENLLYSLFCGVSPECKIVMIGDYNQLPSVGAGQVLKDVIESGSVKVTYLNTLYRQDSNSNINYFAKDILCGNTNFSYFNNSDDLTFVSCTSSSVKNILKDFLTTYKDISIYDLQILAPMYKGDNGIDYLNSFCQSFLNSKSLVNELKYNDVSFKENDKVICLVNNLDDNVFNGDIGRIVSITGKGKKEIVCNFDDNVSSFDSSNFDNINLGYAISIHKAQGSEFDIVILPMFNSYKFMLYRKLFYTAVTRAKKKLIILGEESAIKKAIMTDRDENRKTILKDFLSNGIYF